AGARLGIAGKKPDVSVWATIELSRFCALAARCGVPSPVGRDDTIACFGQRGDDAGGQGVGIATRCFSDRVRDYPFDGCAIEFRHSALLVPMGLTSSRIPPLPTAGWPPLVNHPICAK